MLYAGRGSRSYVGRPPNSGFDNWGLTSVMWSRSYGIGQMYWTIIVSNVYVDILRNVMLPCNREERPIPAKMQKSGLRTTGSSC